MATVGRMEMARGGGGRLTALGGAGVDLLTALAAAVILPLGTRAAARGQTPVPATLDGWTYLLLAVAAVALAARRRFPLSVLAVEAAALATYLAGGNPYGPMLLVVTSPAYTVGTRYGRRATLVAAALGGVTVVVGGALGGHAHGFNATVGTLSHVGLVLGPAVIGLLARSTRVNAGQAREEAERRRAEQARLQVAREVHDVVGHGLSVISLQAGVALHVLDRRPEQAQVALEAIRRTSLEALAELRETLALTREAEGAGEDGRVAANRARHDPLTGLARLDGLVTGVRLCGLPLTAAITGPARPLPPDVDLTAFRVVREALTNVLRHAGAARARVDVRYEPDRVVVEVTDEPRDGVLAPAGHESGSADPASGSGSASASAAAVSDQNPLGERPGGGRGLAGLAARVTEIGGSMTAGPVAGGGWLVRATLPVPAADDDTPIWESVEPHDSGPSPVEPAAVNRR